MFWKSLIVCSLLIFSGMGCQKVSPKSEVPKKEVTFKQKEECASYKDNINKEVEVFNQKQIIERRGDNDGSYSFCKEIRELQEVFYSPKVNSCIQAITEKTLCQPNQNVAFHVSYEYLNLKDVLTEKQLESFRVIWRGEGYESMDDIQQKIENYKK